MSKSVAVVMAAGKGTRMKSDLPKVLLEVDGRPMIEYVLDALTAGGVDEILVVVGYQADLVKKTLAHRPGLTFCLQEEQLGTGHAVMMCRDELAKHDGAVLVVAGDSPLMLSSSISALLAEFEKERPACLLGTGYKDNPFGLGRVVRDEQRQFVGIVEEKDATEEQRKITEVNLSCYIFDCQELLHALEELSPENAQGEYYVTDCPGIMLQQGKPVRAADVLQACEALSINTIDELAVVEAAMREMRTATDS